MGPILQPISSKNVFEEEMNEDNEPKNTLLKRVVSTASSIGFEQISYRPHKRPSQEDEDDSELSMSWEESEDDEDDEEGSAVWVNEVQTNFNDSDEEEEEQNENNDQSTHHSASNSN